MSQSNWMTALDRYRSPHFIDLRLVRLLIVILAEYTVTTMCEVFTAAW